MLRFSTPGEAAEFVELASRTAKNLLISQAGSLVKVILPTTGVKGEYAKVMSLVKQWKLSRGVPRGGVYKHSAGLLLSSTQLRVATPLAAVAEVLQLIGFTARVEGGYVVTSASFSQALRAVEALSDKYAEALELDAAPMARRLAAVLAAARSLPLKEAVEELRERGLAKVDERSGRLALAVNYEEALQRLRETGSCHATFFSASGRGDREREAEGSGSSR